jgi:vacuolar protein sorting-associated protein VTA1
MAADIPASLKSADIGRFAARAAQVERAKPIIAYWCESQLSSRACPGTS